MTPKKFNILIADTTCLIVLQKINFLDLLKQLSHTVLATPEIAAEFGAGMPEWIIIQSARYIELQNEINKHLDLGESSAIALASEINYDFLLIDDAEARKFAERNGLKVKGTLGMLLLAKNNGVIKLLKPYFDRIQQTNFRISQKILDNILHKAGE